MEKSKKNAAYYIGLISGLLAIGFCFATIGLSVSDTYVSIYTLSVALMLLGVNRIGLHLSNFKKNMVENICLTAFIFVMAVLLGLTKYNIYFLISSFFAYSMTIALSRIFIIKEDKSIQSIIFNVLIMVLSFLFSFVFFFPVIYAKHATSVSNSNFIVLCYSIVVIVSSSKNLIFPYHKKLKLNVISNIIKKSMINEIFMTLAILVILCSVYFTVVEQHIVSYVDALWYSFSLITTIGLGDVVVTTTFGRILSVMLGISGIVVVAVFTSFIVNFYNEMNKKRDERALNKLAEEVKELEESKEEIESIKDEEYLGHLNSLSGSLKENDDGKDYKEMIGEEIIKRNK